mmetsp:Transcript_8909/g.26348  ORF Transcript_8909/g.26348 Transcript_8909/m.26348 type:complete len:289 (+) Transcript_8909:236-1102(+)
MTALQKCSPRTTLSHSTQVRHRYQKRHSRRRTFRRRRRPHTGGDDWGDSRIREHRSARRKDHPHHPNPEQRNACPRTRGGSRVSYVLAGSSRTTKKRAMAESAPGAPTLSHTPHKDERPGASTAHQITHPRHTVRHAHPRFTFHRTPGHRERGLPRARCGKALISMSRQPCGEIRHPVAIANALSTALGLYRPKKKKRSRASSDQRRTAGGAAASVPPPASRSSASPPEPIDAHATGASPSRATLPASNSSGRECSVAGRSGWSEGQAPSGELSASDAVDMHAASAAW